MEPDIDGPYLISVRAIRRWADPFTSDVWNNGSPIKRAEVRAAIRERRFEERQNERDLRRTMTGPENRRFDVERIAYLTENVSSHPICLDVPAGGDVRIEDGCHRIAAAIMRGDEFILAEYGGWTEVFHRTFRKKRLP